MIREHVALPDARTHPLLHPLDVPPAAAAFTSARRWSLMTDGSVLFLVGALAWSLSGAWLTTTASVLGLVLIGSLAGAAREREAWSYIPLRRQDRDRALPARWGSLVFLLSVFALGAGCVLLLWWMQRVGVGVDVTSFALGSALGVALVVLLDVWTTQQSAASVNRPLASLTALAAAAAAGLAITLLVPPESVRPLLLAAGAGLLTLVHLGGKVLSHKLASRRS